VNEIQNLVILTADSLPSKVAQAGSKPRLQTRQ
jgi:hypothetical protein